MAMTRQTYSISALAIELGKDRRTIAREVEGLAPAESRTVGGRVVQRWYLTDVLAHLERPPASRAQEERIEEGTAELMNVVKVWAGHTMYPRLVSNDHFARNLLMYARADLGASKAQAYELLAFVSHSILMAICDGFKDPKMLFNLCERQHEWGEATKKGKVAEFVAKHWPDKPKKAA